jgi:tRNA uridine 5-carboxymethylaminomethyl modification enzyme
MVDDLVTRGVSEPYRMFTSRAEFRLHLRSDNADQRLTALAQQHGLVGEQRAEKFAAKQAALASGRKLLESLSTTPTEARKAGLLVNADGHRRSAFELLSYPNMTPNELARVWPEIANVPAVVLDQVAIDAQYSVYLDRQQADIAAMRRDETREIPEWLDYTALPGLSAEMKQKLSTRRPATIAQAQAIDGVTPAAITLILSVVRRGTMRKAG